MRDIYLYEGTDVLRNLLNIRDRKLLEEAEADLLKLYGPTAMPDVDKLLTDFYQLNDDARSEVIQFLNMKRKNHRDPDRVKDIKKIPGWK